jgi:hypothetical protein
VEFELDLEWDQPMIQSLIEDGEMTPEEAEGEEFIDGDADDLRSDPAQLEGECVAVKSGLFENRLWGNIVKVESVTESSRESESNHDSVTD